jgi:hypothetical protein
MKLDRALANDQLRGNLLIGQTLSHEGKHFSFAGGKRIDLGFSMVLVADLAQQL